MILTLRAFLEQYLAFRIVDHYRKGTMKRTLSVRLHFLHGAHWLVVCVDYNHLLNSVMKGWRTSGHSKDHLPFDVGTGLRSVEVSYNTFISPWNFSNFMNHA